MQKIDLPHTRMLIHARVMSSGGLKDHQVYEGDAVMNQVQQDYYKDIVGDGQARVTVGRDLAEKDYGNGGGVFVNVSLACDQSQAAISQAIQLAYQVADGAVWHYQQQVKQELINRGILKP
jgi:hypothetical protein